MDVVVNREVSLKNRQFVSFRAGETRGRPFDLFYKVAGNISAQPGQEKTRIIFIMGLG